VPIGVQLAHAGRKGSTAPPWDGSGQVPPSRGGWRAEAACALPFGDLPAPDALTTAGLARVREDFTTATQRAVEAGFDVVEVHMAHGYLLHGFLSPLSNDRDDGYGGSFEGRVHFPLQVLESVRAAWPDDRPLFVRVSATDWVEGGWTIEDTVRLAPLLAERGTDLLDCSTGGIVADARIPVGPGYQVPLAAAVRREAGIPSAAVGMITEPAQAEEIVSSGQADAVLLARELLRDPYWPRHAARALGVEVAWPLQYDRAAPRRAREAGPAGQARADIARDREEQTHPHGD
jgi:2,4-dienoyl-CoA reductase-like NADH-dependent reductase (Old Yellow Enzyme family)